MHIVVVGGGKVGEALAQSLSVNKHTVIVVEKDEATAKKLAEDLNKTMVINGDGCDPRILEDAGISKAQVVSAVTGDDEDNLIICQLAKEGYKVPRTIARINNPKNETTFQKLGIVAVSSTSIISKLIGEETTVGDIVKLLTLKRGKLTVAEINVTADSPVVGKAIKDLKLPSECVLTSIVRGSQIIFPKGESVLQAEDSIIALTTPENEKELKKVFLAKSRESTKL